MENEKLEEKREEEQEQREIEVEEVENVVEEVKKEQGVKVEVEEEEEQEEVVVEKVEEVEEVEENENEKEKEKEQVQPSQLQLQSQSLLQSQSDESEELENKNQYTNKNQNKNKDKEEDEEDTIIKHQQTTTTETEIEIDIETETETDKMELTDEWNEHNHQHSQKLIEELRNSIEPLKHENAQLLYRIDVLESTIGTLRDRNNYLEMETTTLDQLVTQAREKEKYLIDELDTLRARIQMYENAYEEMDHSHSSHHGHESEHGGRIGGGGGGRHEREPSKDEDHSIDTSALIDKEVSLWKQKYDELATSNEELSNENLQLKEEQTRLNDRADGLQEEYLRLMDQVKYYDNIQNENEVLHQQIEKLRRKSIELPQSMRVLANVDGEEDTGPRKMRSKTISNDPVIPKSRTLLSDDNWFQNDSVDLMAMGGDHSEPDCSTLMLTHSDDASKIIEELDHIWAKMLEYLEILKDDIDEKAAREEEEEEEQIHTLANEVGQIANTNYLHILIKIIDSAKLNAEKLYECCLQLQKEKEHMQVLDQIKMKKLCQEIMGHQYKKYDHVKEIWRECASKTMSHFWKSYSPFPHWF